MTTKREARAGTQRWLRVLYNELNEEFFDNKLPKKLKFEWVDMAKVNRDNLVARVLWTRLPHGVYVPHTVQFSDRMRHKSMQKKAGFSMLHEMVHLKLGVHVQCEEWDGEFDKEMFKLAEAGAFRLFW